MRPDSWDNMDVFWVNPRTLGIMDRDEAARLGMQSATMAERAEYMANVQRVRTEEDPAPRKKGCGGCGKKVPRGTPAEDRKLTMAERAKGAAGLVKASTGYDLAPADVQESRWKTCLGCESNLRGVCQECGCHVSAKLRIQGEACPRQQWDS